MSKTNKTIAILQLTRMGDIIQTIQACHGIKDLNPDTRLVLIARKEFVDHLNFLTGPLFDKVIGMDSKLIASHNNVKDSLDSLNSFLDQVNEEDISVLVNLSFSKVSGHIASLISSTHKLGLSRDRLNNVVLPDKWSQYIYATVMTGPSNVIPLVEIYKHILGNKSKQVGAIENKSKHNTIVVHPFASHIKKMWPAGKWAELIRDLAKENPTASIQIVGSGANEKKLSEEILASTLISSVKNRIENYVDTASVEQVFDLLKNAKLFVGHDSLVGNLASLAGTTTLTVALGTVRPIETAPYKPNSYIVSPKTSCFPCFPDDTCTNHLCHADASFKIVSSIAKQLYSSNKLDIAQLKSETSIINFRNVDIFSSSLKNNVLKFQSLTQNTDNEQSVISQSLKLAFQFVVSDIDETATFSSMNEKTYQAVYNSLQGIQYIYNLAELGKNYCRYIVEDLAKDMPNMASIKAHSEKLDEIDYLLNSISQTYPLCSPILNYFKVAKGNIAGGNLVEIAENSFYTYNETSMLVSVMYDLLEKTLAEYKHINKISNKNINM